MHEGYCSCLVCVSVCVCDTALAASVYIHKQRYSRVSLRLFLDFDSWIFENKFPFESYVMKKPICKQVRAHHEPFSCTFRTNEGQQLPEAQLVGRMLLERQATSVKQARHKQLTTDYSQGLQEHVRACVVYERTAVV